ncbi:hypothetical protein AB0M36_01690 [Actinoplanes sp. NPDC051346]|uniref:hypothetical protein n=1 Tax=Actinoplanes sp. NPDC051346 TaxID=3155048 RepID=UPI00341AE99F
MNASTRALWLALMVFFGMVVAVLAGLLSWAGGDSPFAAVLTGGGAFGATVLLLLAIFYFATASPGVRKPDDSKIDK